MPDPTDEIEPDYLMLANPDLRDGGPRYTETPADPYAPDARPVAEPWNAVTAALFVAVAAVWLVRLRGRYARYPFLCSCLPILLVGGVGGTLYHGTRANRLFLYLDVFPIQILGLAGAVFLATRVWRRGLLFMLGALALYAGTAFLLFELVAPRSRQMAISLNYLALAATMVLPMAAVLVKTRFRHLGWVAGGLLGFGVAWFFRRWDEVCGPYLPMGSHWLWHVFGAASTAFVIEFFYRVEGETTHRPRLAGGSAN